MKSFFAFGSLFALTLVSLGTLAAAPPANADLDPVPGVEPIPGTPFLHAGPLVGHVTDSTVSLWAKASNAARLSFKIGKTMDLADVRRVDGPALVADASFTGQVEVTELEPATRYYYVPLLDDVPALTRPFPSFMTAPAADSAARLRIAVGSCVGRRGTSAAAALGEMAERNNFDLLLMVGDNHYGDTTDPALLRDHLFMHRSVGGFEKMIRRTPTYAIWDDHDFGPNNSDGTSKGKEDSLKVFQQWWANPAYGEPDNPGCYYRFSHSGIDFFMLDVRYYRTPNRTPEDGSKTMLGERQLAWLKQGLAESQAKFKVVASGSEFQTMTQPDCWSSFARERQQIFDHITENKIDGVVLLSGDRHFTAGYQVQGRHLEFTSGPLGSGNATLHDNPERFSGYDEGKMWVVLELDPTAAEPQLAYEFWQAGGGLLERRELSYDEVSGRATIAASPALSPVRMEPKPAQ
ncbi:alkaline phosphatase D family protein [Novipirellula sp. SH528]|uniref:alkaline phosphatase D family protein n=1 Tax=Novipirellula sp. SH528 TaxID=3454466 RepID=UPI003F9F048F